MDMQTSLNVAELKAKKRELNQGIDLESVNKEAEKADRAGYILVKKKDKSTINFSRTINKNNDYLQSIEYLTNAEGNLLYRLMPLVELNSNAIVDKDGQFMTITALAKYLKRDVSGLSVLINQLINKGILFEFVNVVELKMFNRSISQRPLFVNPEIILAGGDNKINATLSRLVLHNDLLEKNKIHLPIKVWINLNDKYGKLVSRATYLKNKKREKK